MPKSQHGTLSSSERQVAVLHPVVLPSAHFTAVEIAQLAHCGRVGPESLGHDGTRLAVPLQGILQKLQSRCFIALFRHKGFEDLALVINRTPQIIPLAVDPDEHFIEVLSPVMKPTHSRDTLPPAISRE